MRRRGIMGKLREFWIRDQFYNFGSDIGGAQYVAFTNPEIEGKAIIHVREVNPELDAAIEKCESVLKIAASYRDHTCNIEYGNETGIETCVKCKIVNALAALKKARGEA